MIHLNKWIQSIFLLIHFHCSSWIVQYCIRRMNFTWDIQRTSKSNFFKCNIKSSQFIFKSYFLISCLKVGFIFVDFCHPLYHPKVDFSSVSPLPPHKVYFSRLCFTVQCALPQPFKVPHGHICGKAHIHFQVKGVSLKQLLKRWRLTSNPAGVPFKLFQTYLYNNSHILNF
jgi:hypothetical protein